MSVGLLVVVGVLAVVAAGLAIASFRRTDAGFALAAMVVMIASGVVAAVFAGVDSA